MSHCLIIKQGNDVFVGADSALSTKVNKKYYRLNGNINKLHRFDNILIFCSGKMSIVSPIIKKIKNISNLNLNDIQSTIKNEYTLHNGNEDIDVIVIVQDEIPKIYSISPYNDFKIVELGKNSQNINIWSAGIKTNIGIEFCEQEIKNGNNNIIRIYKNVFDKLASEVIGGSLHLYHINDKEIRFIYKGLIDDENIKRINIPQYIDTHSVVAERLIGKVILGEKLEISDEEGTFVINGNLLTIKDRNEVVRLRLGEYSTNRFGLQLMNRTGKEVILDEMGMLQTWQEGRTDNVDQSHGLTLYVYLPPETLSVRRALLNFRLLPFRSYSSTTESGGGSVQTSSNGGSVQTTTANGGGTSTSTQSGGSVSKTTASGGSYSDTTSNQTFIALPYQTQGPSDIDVNGYATHYHRGVLDGSHFNHSHSVSIPSHSHGFSVPSHTHAFSVPNHTHSITIPSHNHSVTIPSHSHGIKHGIYVGTFARGVGVIINGINRTTALGGKFNTSQANIEIGQYLNIGQWNEITLTSDSLGRIDGNVFVQAFMGT